MKTLIVGGTGFAGGYTALFLKNQGWDVTLMGRNAPDPGTALGQLPFRQGDYLDPNFDVGSLEGFDGMIFAAGVDITKFPTDGSETFDSFYHRCNTVGMPAFFEKAKTAGIRRTVNLGSFYAHVAPQSLSDPYVASRHASCQNIRALSGPDFNVCGINAPFILGRVPDLAVPHLSGMKAYVQGLIPEAPLFAPKGGTNHVTLETVAEALQGGLERGESGKAYLIGDANYSWKEYLERWATAAGAPQAFEVRDDIEHPLLPSIIMYAGAGATVSYVAPEDERALLGYGIDRMAHEIEACAKHY